MLVEALAYLEAWVRERVLTLVLGLVRPSSLAPLDVDQHGVWRLSTLLSGLIASNALRGDCDTQLRTMGTMLLLGLMVEGVPQHHPLGKDVPLPRTPLRTSSSPPSMTVSPPLPTLPVFVMTRAFRRSASYLTGGRGFITGC